MISYQPQLFVSIALFADFMVFTKQILVCSSNCPELSMSSHKICIIIKDDKQVIPNSHGQHIMNNHLGIYGPIP